MIKTNHQLTLLLGLLLALSFTGIAPLAAQTTIGEFQPVFEATLTAFGALMVATNVFNNALDVDLDAYLEPYRKGNVAPAAAPTEGAI